MFVLFFADTKISGDHGTNTNRLLSFLIIRSLSSSPFSSRSILFTAIIRPFSCSSAYWAMWQSCFVTPFSPSIKRMTISDLSMPFSALKAENFSIPLSLLPLLLSPAVSIRLYF